VNLLNPRHEDREPKLEWAMPADIGEGPRYLENTQADVQLRDGSWVWCNPLLATRRRAPAPRPSSSPAAARRFLDIWRLR